MTYLIVEGITDVALIKYICFKKDITTNFNDFKKTKSDSQVGMYKYNDFYIIDTKGQDKLEYTLSKILAPVVPKINKIAIIQDVDDDFKQSTQKIDEALKEAQINKEKVEYFLTPNNKDNGDLETLLLSTLKDNNIIKCFDDYEKCLKQDNDIHPKAINKGKVYAYTMYSQKGKNLYKPQDSFMNIKKSKDTKLWDLNKKEFAPIIAFVLKILK